MIPKIIHQTWRNNDIPNQWIKSRDSIIRHNPEYHYILWKDIDIHEFMKSYYPAFYQMFLSYKYKIQQIDAFRYFILYHYGGIYIDLDIGCKASFDKYLDNDLVLAKSINVSKTLTNSIMMASPQHPFMYKCIRNLEDYQNNYEYFGQHLHVMNSTGPFYLQNQMNESDLQYAIIPESDFKGDCSVCNVQKCMGGNVFYHVKGNSWHDTDSRVYNYVFCHLTIGKLSFVILVFLILTLFYLKRFR